MFIFFFFFFKQKTAYEMVRSDWSSDVCSSDLIVPRRDVTVSRVVVPARRVDDDGRSWYVVHRRRRRWRVHDGGWRWRVDNCGLLHYDGLLDNDGLTNDVGGAVEDRLAS